MTPDNLISRSEDLIFAEVDGEAVALSAAKGVCYGLNGVGLRILQLIDAPATIEKICAHLIAEYDVDAPTCESQVMDLLTEFEAEGLVVVERRRQNA